MSDAFVAGAAEPSDPWRLDRRVALVTGGAGNLGSAICANLAAAGATVIVASRDLDRCERVVDRISAAGGSALALSLDLADSASIEAAIATTCDRFGHLDILVNNAITQIPGHVESYSLADWEASMAVDATGWFHITRLALRRMLEREHGNIISIASILGRVSADDRLYPQGVAGFRPHYFFVKAGVVGFTRFIAATYARRGIRANVVSPGGIQTDPPRPDGSGFVDRTPMGRLAQPDEIAQAVRFLAMDASSYVTAHELVVDGGYTAW